MFKPGKPRSKRQKPSQLFSVSVRGRIKKRIARELEQECEKKNYATGNTQRIAILFYRTRSQLVIFYLVWLIKLPCEENNHLHCTYDLNVSRVHGKYSTSVCGRKQAYGIHIVRVVHCRFVCVLHVRPVCVCAVKTCWRIFLGRADCSKRSDWLKLFLCNVILLS